MRRMIFTFLLAVMSATAAMGQLPSGDQCNFVNGATAAFCDTFDSPQEGGRAGDLDPTKWAFYRTTQNFNPGQGMLFSFYPVTAEHCDILVPGVLPDMDSTICGQQFGEHNYWITSMNDGGGFVWVGARALQPFDFANRTGTIVFNVDAKTDGGHSWWPEIVIADMPEPNAQESNPASTGIGIRPRNGISLHFGGKDCVSEPAAGRFPGDTTKSTGGMETVKIFRNYHEFDVRVPVNTQNPCYTVQANHQNHFEIRLSQNRLEVWASDAPPDDGIGEVGPNFRRILVEDKLGLTFTRGYVSFQHVQYNAAKDGTDSPMQTYHWSSLGFDGPVLGPQRDYQVADSLVPAGDGSLQVGYWLDTPGLTFQLSNVDPSNSVAAWLTFNYEYVTNRTPMRFRYRLNGRAWKTFTDPKRSPNFGTAGIIMPVDLTDLVVGTNTVELMPGNNPAGIANIDLLIDPASGATATTSGAHHQ